MTTLKDKLQTTLDECRMLILGGEFLISFALEATLKPRFEALPDTARWACGVAMIMQVAAVGLLMWPATYHRLACRGEGVPELLHFTNGVLGVALMPFAIGLSASMFVVGICIQGLFLGLAFSITTLLSAITTWYVVPLIARAASSERKAVENTPEPAAEPTSLADKVRHVLTEARMVLPGAQALLGFGSIAVLTNTFEELPMTLKVVHVIGLGFIALAVLLLMMPAAYHRIALDGEHTEGFHRIAGRLLLGAMAALAPGLAAAVWIVVERVSTERVWGITAATCTIVIFYGMWFGWTSWARIARTRQKCA